MTYLCGIGRGKRTLGIEPRDPAVICDGCGARKVVRGKPMPPEWFLGNLPPPGWKGLRMANGEKSWHLCTLCWNPVSKDMV